MKQLKEIFLEKKFIIVKLPDPDQDVIAWNGKSIVAAKYVIRNTVVDTGTLETKMQGYFQVEKYSSIGDRSLVSYWSDITHWMPSTIDENTGKIDPKYLGIPNINFSLTAQDDEREAKFAIERMTRGFDVSETWSLRDTIAEFIYPRLVEYRKQIEVFIVDNNNLYADVDAAIYAFGLVIRDNDLDGEMVTNEEWKEFERGMDAFARVYLRLWW